MTNHTNTNKDREDQIDRINTAMDLLKGLTPKQINAMADDDIDRLTGQLTNLVADINSYALSTHAERDQP